MSQLTGVLSPFLEKQRLSQLKKYVTDEQNDILEIGCGETRFPEIFKNKIKSYTGFDILENVIEKNKKKFSAHSFYAGNILTADIDGGPFDHIVLLAFIEHLKYSDVVSLFLKLKPLLKKHGTILVTTPHPKAQKIHEFGAKIGLFSKEAAHEHQCFFDKDLLYQLSEESHLRVKQYTPFQFGLNQFCVYEKP